MASQPEAAAPVEVPVTLEHQQAAAEAVQSLLAVQPEQPAVEALQAAQLTYQQASEHQHLQAQAWPEAAQYAHADAALQAQALVQQQYGEQGVRNCG